jgi:1-deoxy-D-xylulose-5-phosphate reductoisomerase
MSAANETAVHRFLDHRLSFNRIYDCAAAAVEKLGIVKDPDLDTILEADAAARRFAREYEK